METHNLTPLTFQNLYNMTEGFGSGSKTTFWQGGLQVNKQTFGKQLALRVELWDEKNTFFSAEFDYIGMRDSDQNYKMNIGTFIKGSAGDGKIQRYSAPLATSDNDKTSMSCYGHFSTSWWYRDSNFPSKDDCVTSILVPNSQAGIKWVTLPKNRIVKAAMKARYYSLSHGKYCSLIVDFSAMTCNLYAGPECPKAT